MSKCFFFLDPENEIDAQSEKAKECPVQTEDESFSHTFNDVHPEQLKTNANNETGVPKSPTIEAMGDSFSSKEEVPRSISSTSSASPATSRKSMLTIVLDLNGLLVKCSREKPSSVYESIQLNSKIHVRLRPGCIQFLKALVEKFNVGIWSTTEGNVLQMLRILQDKAGEVIPFCVAWSQEACKNAKSGKIARPDKPTLEALFKPLSKISACFDCDACRTILIDDSPYKECTSPDSNCIYLAKFDEEKMLENILIDELYAAT